MDVLKRLRTACRREFTLLANKVEDAHGTDDFFSIFDALEEASMNLFKIEEEVRRQWCAESNPDMQDYEADQDKYLSYKLRWHTIKRKASQHLAHTEQATAIQEPKRRLPVLPKLEVKQFDGDIKSWLLFWGQFKKIDEDIEIDDSDKFQYLLQSMTPNSSPRHLLESYPPCAENYKKALDALKQRFARDDALIETYIRGLLSLMQSKPESVTYLYDNLQTNLQALETLGVIKDTYAIMLFPMVESALPSDVLRAWHRSKPVSRNISTIMEFLRTEVESEERIKLCDKVIPTTLTPIQPTACFVSRVERKGDAKSSTSCLWCERDTHSSVECFRPTKLSLQARKEFVNNKKACTICLRSDHLAKRCKLFPRCLICKKRHVTIMCPDVTAEKENKPEQTTKMDTNVTCHSSSANATLLPTLIVKIVNNKKEIIVRALIDSGSQRSYIKKDIVHSLDLKPMKQEVIKQSLFGGLGTKAKMCNIYDTLIKSVDNKFHTKLSLVQQSHICKYLPRLRSVNVLNNLREKGILLHDFYYNDVPDDIGLLIGADFFGKILTGDVVQLDNLTALGTKLGWSIQGPIQTPASYSSLSNTLHCLTNYDISEFQCIGTLGIREPAKVLKASVRNRKVKKHFKENIKDDIGGRYEVALPWKDTPRPRNNHKVARERSESTTSRLKQLGTDGVSRVARIRTSVGTRIRPVQRLFPLELHKDSVPEIDQTKNETDTTSDPDIRPRRNRMLPSRLLDDLS